MGRAQSIVIQPDDPITISGAALFLEISSKSGTTSPEVYPRPNGQVYICEGASNIPLPPSASDILPEPGLTETLQKIARHVSSNLDTEQTAKLILDQACYLPNSRDGIPLIGEVDFA